VNYRGNQLACNAADRAIQVHGGVGYSRHKPFEHIYRHHRRYRITEGSDELQLRRIAGKLFGFSKPAAQPVAAAEAFSVELVALVKHDCPVCDQVLPVLDAAGIRIVSQSSAADTADQAQRLGLSRVPELDEGLLLSGPPAPAPGP